MALSDLLAACEARVQLVQPNASTSTSVLTLVALDTGLGQRAGWSPGVPGTTVFIRRDEDPTVHVFASDDRGVLSLAGLPAADYWVWAESHPSGPSLQPPVLAPPALGGGLRETLSRGTARVVPMRGQENGSLLISEFYYHAPPSSVYGEVGMNYQFHWYIELYNNSDTTIYLDGKILGSGANYWLDAPLWPCAETEPFRNDPRGVWSQMFQRFPGAGRDYPLASGSTVVIAEQAIDHGAVFAGLPDMSHADFQFYWPNRALNPTVPTMLPIQLRVGALQTVFLGVAVAFVAEAVDIASLERMGGRYTVVDDVLFPRTAILDLAVLYPDSYVLRSSTGIPYCRNLVHASLDALSAFVMPTALYHPATNHLLSAQRKLLPDGQHLQRTGTSAVDWEIRARSPGRVP